MNKTLSCKNGNLAPLPAGQALDNFFLEARCKLLDVAAILDRINRGLPSEELENDPRLLKIRQALEVLLDRSGGRAEAHPADLFAGLRPDLGTPSATLHARCR